MPLWLSHISYLVITDMLLSSQILGGHRQVFVACLCLPYTPPTFLSKAAMPAYTSKPSHTARDRVAQPGFHFLFTTSSFCGPIQILGGSLIKSICPRPLPAAFIIWPTGCGALSSKEIGSSCHVHSIPWRASPRPHRLHLRGKTEIDGSD